MLKIKDIQKLIEYGFEENENLRTDKRKTYVYKDNSEQYYHDFKFIIYNDADELWLDTSACGLSYYGLRVFAEIFFDLIQAGIVEKVDE